MNERVKYVQDGTGQVAFLVFQPDSEKWAIDLFAGGPDPFQRVSEWDSCEEAESALETDSFKKATE